MGGVVEVGQFVGGVVETGQFVGGVVEAGQFVGGVVEAEVFGKVVEGVCVPLIVKHHFCLLS